MARDLTNYRPDTHHPTVLRAVKAKAQDPPDERRATLRDPFGVLDHIQWGPMDLAELDHPGSIKCENPY